MEDLVDGLTPTWEPKRRRLFLEAVRKEGLVVKRFGGDNLCPERLSGNHITFGETALSHLEDRMALESKRVALGAALFYTQLSELAPTLADMVTWMVADRKTFLGILNYGGFLVKKSRTHTVY